MEEVLLRLNPPPKGIVERVLHRSIQGAFRDTEWLTRDTTMQEIVNEVSEAVFSWINAYDRFYGPEEHKMDGVGFVALEARGELRFSESLFARCRQQVAEIVKRNPRGRHKRGNDLVLDMNVDDRDGTSIHISVVTTDRISSCKFPYDIGTAWIDLLPGDTAGEEAGDPHE